MAYKSPKLNGDVTGDPTTTTVSGLLTNALPSLTDGYLNWTGSAWALSIVSGGGGSPTGSAGGDLTGTYPNPTVASLTGSAGTITIPHGTTNISGATAASDVAPGTITITGQLPF